MNFCCAGDMLFIFPIQTRESGLSIMSGWLPKKKVPVNVRLTGKPHSDFEVKAVVTEPSEVQVEGTAARLARISAVDTETVNISELRPAAEREPAAGGCVTPVMSPISSPSTPASIPLAAPARNTGRWAEAGFILKFSTLLQLHVQLLPMAA